VSFFCAIFWICSFIVLKLNATRGIKPLPHLFFLHKKQDAVERKNSYRIFYLQRKGE
jgi:hypothetical protein